MRISDWSSDVCSSDLQNRACLHVWLRKIAGVEDDDGESYEAATRAIEAIFSVRRSDRALTAVFDSAFDNGTALKAGLARWVGAGNQIGRASWRERVCQYV